MRFLIFLLSIFASTAFGAVGDCTITSEATAGALDLKITGCVVDGETAIEGEMYSGKFFVLVDKLDAGSLPLRTKHLKSEKFLDAQKYPKIELTLDKVKMAADQDFTGTITIKGITKPISGKISIAQNKADAMFSVNTTDFNIPKMSHLGVTLRSIVDVKVSLISL